MKEKIYDVIKNQNGKINFKSIHKKFDIDSDSLREILLELKLEGRIMQKGNKYDLFPSDNFIGTVSITSTGKKFIFHDKERLYISSEHGKDVILHDIVSYKINSLNQLEVTSIIDRNLGKMTCEVVNIDGKKKIVPYHEGINIILPNEIMKELLDGDIIMVELTQNNMDDYCDANYIKTIGHRDDPNTRDLIIALNYGFDNDYSEELLEEIKSYPTSVSDEEIVNRCDYREQESFTIDGSNTKDMDDGIYGERIHDNLIRVYVHISDVSHYVKYTSLLFKRACEKTTSAYLNDSVFHMLHHIISNGICSLNPYEDRLTKTVIMDINEFGEIVNYDIVKSVINSKKKMTYDDVDQVLTGNSMPFGYERFKDTLEILHEASLRLENKYLDEGKIDFANNDMDNKYNRDGSIKNIMVMEDGPGRKLIENLMIAANKTVATWLFWSNVPAVYRVHEMPKVDKVNEAIKIINESGFKIRYINNADSPKVIQKLFEKISGTEEFPILSNILVQFMQRASYSIENIGHYALAADAYTHFTSPIRRLPDLLVHTIIDLILENYDKIDQIDFKEMEKKLAYLCKRSSIMERQADEASREAEIMAIVDKMDRMAKSGENYFEARVSGIDKKIKVKVNGIECYVTKDDLGSNFILDKSKRLYYDTDSGRYLKLGSKIIVSLRDLNVVNRTFKLSVLSVPNNDVLENNDVKKRILSK